MKAAGGERPRKAVGLGLFTFLPSVHFFPHFSQMSFFFRGQFVKQEALSVALTPTPLHCSRTIHKACPLYNTLITQELIVTAIQYIYCPLF